MTPTSVYNGNSTHAQLELEALREELFALPPLPNKVTMTVPVLETIAALADMFYDEQQRGLMVMRGGLAKGKRIAEEAEAKMTGLAYLAEQLANGASLNELAVK
jgi:hypothetical protein